MSTTVESIVFITADANIYQIPPLRSVAEGYKASEWDVANPMWSGRLKVVEVDSGKDVRCELRLEDTETGEPFATAPYSYDGKGMEPAKDSSRYFAIRVVNGERHAMLGLGFPDRNVAFDFNVALQDFQHSAAPAKETAPSHKDFSLKEGQTIFIDQKKGSSIQDSEKKSPSTESIPTLLPPPPAPSSGSSKARGDPFDDDFGDFVS